MIGEVLGHYELVGKLGEGGMGVVYKARDTHLDRFVALKLLPAGKVADPERQKRFVQEAKSASALNHPSITHIYDIAAAGEVPFIAMEFVPGKTLDQWIGRKGLRLGEALRCAIQVAGALAAAHAAGIVHRDLKPGNVMMTDSGLVKVLDFGLAKLVEPATESEATRTLREPAGPRTEEGAILGTVAYMSPEQAEGKRVDSRSDIFSFGAVLYEMVTGRRAFQGDSRLSTLTAILREQPKPPSEIVPSLPQEVDRIVSRCLRKDPARRFQHMDDLRVALEDLKEDSESGSLKTPAAMPARKLSRVWAAAAAALLAALAVGWWAWTGKPSQEATPTVIPLTSYPGIEHSPSFSPDGNQVVFVWNGPKQDNPDLYVKLVGSDGVPLRLTTDAAADVSPAWSPDGRWIAFVRFVRPTRSGSRTVLLVPPIGGTERKIAEIEIGEYRTGGLAWSPDANWLALSENGAIWLLNIETAEKRRITSPPPSQSVGDRSPSFSPDGRELVWARADIPGSGEVYLQSLTPDLKPSGEPRQITFDHAQIGSPVWLPDGNEILLPSARAGRAADLWRIGLSGRPTLRRAGVGATALDVEVSRQGNRLAYAQYWRNINIWRMDTQTLEKQPLIVSTREEVSPQYSPDGTRIVLSSARTGTREIWSCDADGNHPVQLTSYQAHSGSPRWSPDGRQIVFDSNVGGHFEVYVMNAGGGAPRKLTATPKSESVAPSWSQDGQWIYFHSDRSGTSEIWRMPAAGGEAVQITRKGGTVPVESPDGKSIYYCLGNTLRKVPVDGGDEITVAENVEPRGFSMIREGIFLLRRGDAKRSLEFLDWNTGQVRHLASFEKPVTIAIAASPDGRHILYPQVDQQLSDLMLVENFR